MIDTHCHLLPNIDDGSRSVDQSQSVLKEFARAGVTDVILTPHLAASAIGERGEEAIERRAKAFEQLRHGAPQLPRLALGFEIMLDQPLPVLAMGDRRFSLAGSRYYLVEFPLTIVPQFAVGALQQMARAGAIPLVAHPERYEACSVESVAMWRSAGAKIQVDATTLTRAHARGRKAREIVEAGLADLVAADNHGDNRTVRTAADFLSGAGGERAVAALTTGNPGAILRDTEMSAVPRIEIKSGGIVGRIARLFGQ